MRPLLTHALCYICKSWWPAFSCLQNHGLLLVWGALSPNFWLYFASSPTPVAAPPTSDTVSWDSKNSDVYWQRATCWVKFGGRVPVKDEVRKESKGSSSYFRERNTSITYKVSEDKTRADRGWIWFCVIFWRAILLSLCCIQYIYQLTAFSQNTCLWR